MPEFGSARQATVLAITGGLLALVLWRADFSAPLPPAVAPAVTTAVPPAADDPAPDAAPTPVDTVTLRRRRLIRHVEVKPRRPCRGDDVTVRVVLAPEADDSKVSILGRAGLTTVLRFRQPGRETIPVVARDWGDGVQVRRAQVDVQDCDGAPLTVEAHRIDADRVALRVIGGAADARYRWRFGDGGEHTGPEATLLHDYGNRAQDRSSSTFLVTVETRGLDGEFQRGRAAVDVPNPLWVAGRGGTYWLAATAERFVPPAGTDGVRTATVYLRSAGKAVRLDGIQLTGFACRNLQVGIPATLPLDRASESQVPAQGGATIAMSLPPDLWPEPVCRMQVRFEGRTDGGAPAAALVGLDLDAPAGRRPVQDRVLLAKLRRARQLLGRSQIAAEDLAALEAEGRL